MVENLRKFEIKKGKIENFWVEKNKKTVFEMLEQVVNIIFTFKQVDIASLLTRKDVLHLSLTCMEICKIMVIYISNNYVFVISSPSKSELNSVHSNPPFEVLFQFLSPQKIRYCSILPLPNLPTSVTYLTFEDDFNDSINNLPNSITHITFGENFNALVNNLPLSQTLHLEMHSTNLLTIGQNL